MPSFLRSVAGLAVLTSVHACTGPRCPPVTPCAADDRCILQDPELRDTSSVARAGCGGSRAVPARCSTSAAGSTIAGVVRTGVNAQVVTVVGRPTLDLQCAGAPQKCWSSMFLADPAAPRAQVALLRAQANQVVPFMCRGDVTAMCCELPADRRTLRVSGTFQAAPAGRSAEETWAGIVVSSVCTVE